MILQQLQAICLRFIIMFDKHFKHIRYFFLLSVCFLFDFCLNFFCNFASGDFFFFLIYYHHQILCVCLHFVYIPSCYVSFIWLMYCLLFIIRCKHTGRLWGSFIRRNQIFHFKLTVLFLKLLCFLQLPKMYGFFIFEVMLFFLRLAPKILPLMSVKASPENETHFEDE